MPTNEKDFKNVSRWNSPTLGVCPYDIMDFSKDGHYVTWDNYKRAVDEINNLKEVIENNVVNMSRLIDEKASLKIEIDMLKKQIKVLEGERDEIAESLHFYKKNLRMGAYLEP